MLYIDEMNSTNNDESAWNFAKDAITINLSPERWEEVHTYYRHAWAAYTLASADNYINILKDLTKQVYSLALPKPIISANPTSGNAPLTVDFDASSSTGTEGQSIQTYNWNFGDPNSGDRNLDTSISTSHEYVTPGEYSVKLTVTDSASLTNSTTQKIQVKSPVHARFTPLDNAPPPLTYHYDASASTDDKGNAHISSDSSYIWDFNGEASATGKEVDYTFSTEGYKLITLTVTDDLGYYDSDQEGVIVGHGEPTIVNGGTITDKVKWTTYGSPYIVLGNITIAEGGTLTIEPGVRVELAGEENNDLLTGVQINVSGTLIASGVTFTWADGQHQWRGIQFNGAGANDSRLEDCTIEHASGLYRYCIQYSGCWDGDFGVIDINNGSPTIIGNTISDALTGISVDNGSPVISNNHITGMTTQGIGVSNSNSSPTVTGNTVTGCGIGLNVSNSNGTYQGNTIMNNTSYGLYYSGVALLDAINNNWGDQSGPLDDSDDRASGGLYNPNGLGNRVSDHVNYYPWVGSSTPAVPHRLSWNT
jgi:hypothetical protein